MRNTPVKGLYTTAKGNETVFVFDCYYKGWENTHYVDYENVMTGEQDVIPLSTFQELFPNKVDKIEVIFKEVENKRPPKGEPLIWNLYTDKAGKSVVYVFDSDTGYPNVREGETIFINVRTSKEDRLFWSEFNKKYPHQVEKIQIEFS